MRIRHSLEGSLVVALVAAAVASSAVAQSPPVGQPGAQRPPSPETPSSPHERLTFFEGTWTTDDSPPERRSRETCAWMEGGRRHMICRTRWLTPAGTWREGMSMFSWDPSDSLYRYYGLRTSGMVEQHRGRATENGWEFFSEKGTGPARTRTRVVITRLKPGEFRLVEQTATGDGPWQLAAEVRYLPAPKDP